MFPIRDHNPSGRTPYVVYILMVANIGIYLSQLGLMEDQFELWKAYYHWAVIPARIVSGDGFETLVTYMFLHAGFLHLAGNMLFLWIFGDNLEDELGHVKFLLFYLASGIGAALVHIAIAPNSAVPTVGASGGIAGILGGYLLLFPRARVDIFLFLIVFFRVFSMPAWLMLGLWLVMQLFGGLGDDGAGGGVAYWAHTGGFVAGMILILPAWIARGGRGFWSRTHGHPPHPESEYKFSPSRIPKIPRK